MTSQQQKQTTTTTTIIGFGSLMSVTSARTTFPNLYNFRIATVTGYRRVFRHPAAIFFERGIANKSTLEIASLCAEPSEDVSSSFEVVVFEVEQTKLEMDAFLKREEEFKIIQCPFIDEYKQEGMGLLCSAGSDEHFIENWGEEVFNSKYRTHGLDTIWNWGPESGILPCAVYLRHCVLSVSKPEFPKRLKDSFLDETYLVDRVTTIREYLQKNANVMESLPPPSLVGRYSG